MAITASCHNKLEPVQYVEAPLRISPLFCVITDNLTDRSQPPFVHSPFPVFYFCVHVQITLMEESSTLGLSANPKTFRTKAKRALSLMNMQVRLIEILNGGEFSSR
jgi:hypothetical protein